MTMRTHLMSTLMFILGGGMAWAQVAPDASRPPQTQEDKALETLSRQKWQWMAARDIESLDKLTEPKALFVHMGATMTKGEELEVIKSGRIEYKEAQIEEISVRTMGDTAIVLSRIQLFALVGGNEARNPFYVTETWLRREGQWRLAALAFTRRSQGSPR